MRRKTINDNMKEYPLACKCCAILSIIAKKRCPDFAPQTIMFDYNGFYRPAASEFLNKIAVHINTK